MNHRSNSEPAVTAQPNSSLMGLPPSTILIGRPRGVVYWVATLMPMALVMVAIRSITPTGRSTMSTPSLSVAPTTWPFFMPPPPTTTDQLRGQWSRPAFWLIRGVRPNSPIQTIVVVSSSRRCGQVGDQGRHPLVQLGEEPLRERVEVVGVGVPAVEGDLDVGDALLHQPPGHQAARAERAPAVGVAHRGRLPVEVEGVLVARVHHPERLGVDRLVIDGRLGVPLAGELVLDLAEHVEPPLHPPVLDVLGRLEVGDRGVRVLHDERGVRHPQEARADARRVDRDAVRQVEVRELLAQLDRAVPSRSPGARPSGWGRSRCASCRCRDRGCLPWSRASG